MFGRSVLLFIATSTLGVALACGGQANCGHCAGAAAAASSTDLTAVDGQTVKLTVNGVHCGGTAASFHAAVMGIEGVKGATVTPDGKAEVKFDAGKTSVDKIIAKVAETSSFTAQKAEGV